MYACVCAPNRDTGGSLVEVALGFSPLVEDTAADAAILDIRGTGSVFGPPGQIAREIQKAAAAKLEIETKEVNVAISRNPDAALVAARHLPGIHLLPTEKEHQTLAGLPIEVLTLVSHFAGIDPHQARDLLETLKLWGLSTLGDLGALPAEGVAETLGPDGLAMHQLARGENVRTPGFIKEALAFQQSIDLDSPVELIEQLSFIVSRMLHELCARLARYGLATNEIRFSAKLDDVSPDATYNRTSSIKLPTDFPAPPNAKAAPGLRADVCPNNRTGIRTDVSPDLNHPAEYERRLQLPFPMCGARWLTRLLLMEIETTPPSSAICSITISAAPVKARAFQNGLFEPLAPETEKLELTLARLARLVGRENVGAPEVKDDHQPDSFRVKGFIVNSKKQRKADEPRLKQLGFRVYRPPLAAEVQLESGRVARLRVMNGRFGSNGRVLSQSGPWKASGRWWSATDNWSREEWDVNLNDGTVCRLFREVTTGAWFVEGIFD